MAYSPICAVDGCDKLRTRYRICTMHRMRLKRNGTLDVGPRHRCNIRWIEAHVDEPDGPCLIWPFSRADGGRGYVYFGGRRIPAPRAMCIMAHGEPPSPGLHAAHSCGNGHLGCMHPKHLRWATPVENAADTLIHGTRVRGMMTPNSILSEDQVREIRASSEKGVRLAERHGVSQSTICCIRKGRRWAWLDG